MSFHFLPSDSKKSKKHWLFDPQINANKQPTPSPIEYVYEQLTITNEF